MRRLLAACLAASLAGTPAIPPPVLAEEPLFLRIRPNDDAAEAARARALREEVWARSDRRARMAIASVCTGCMKALMPAPNEAHGSAPPDAAATGSIADTPPATAGVQ